MNRTTTRPTAIPRLGWRAAVALGVVAIAGAVGWAALFLWQDGGELSTDAAEPGEDAGQPDGGSVEDGLAVKEFMHVHGLEIPAWADGDVLVSTHQGAFRIAEASGDWEWISDEPHDFMGFAAHPQEKGTLYSSGHPAPDSDLPNPIGFMVSTDGGSSWQPRALQGEVDFHALAVHPQDGEVIYGFDGRQGLLRSDDGGREWQQVASGDLQQAGGVVSLAGGLRGVDHVLAGTEVGLLTSSDGGRSWEPLPISGMVTAVAVDVDRQRILAYAAEAEGLLESTDGGESWRSLGLSLAPDAAGHVAVDPDDPDRIWVGTFEQALWRTTDGGQQWEQVAEGGMPTG